MQTPTRAQLPDPENPNARKAPGVEREYRTGEIVVYWEPQLCIHTARCLNALPEVFDVRRRPWVLVDAASADAVADAVMQCPTGALRFVRLDGAPQEPVPDPPIVEVQPDGPLYVHGAITIVDQDGAARDLPRAALCRCGESNNKPFCDGMHDRIGFRTT
jgi:uncharacterized Fe-S cluster protein YjdI